MQLTRLIYSSRRVQNERLDLMGLIQACVQSNTTKCITGLLWYDGRYFIQALEGGRDVVNELYQKIVPDPRHEELRVISVEDIDKREFDQWSMGLAYDGSQSSANNANHLRYATSYDFDPCDLKASSVMSMLLECRENM